MPSLLSREQWADAPGMSGGRSGQGIDPDKKRAEQLYDLYRSGRIDREAFAAGLRRTARPGRPPGVGEADWGPVPSSPNESVVAPGAHAATHFQQLEQLRNAGQISQQQFAVATENLPAGNWAPPASKPTPRHEVGPAKIADHQTRPRRQSSPEWLQDPAQLEQTAANLMKMSAPAGRGRGFVPLSQLPRGFQAQVFTAAQESGIEIPEGWYVEDLEKRERILLNLLRAQKGEEQQKEQLAFAGGGK